MDRGSSALSVDLDLVSCRRGRRAQARSCRLRRAVQRAAKAGCDARSASSSALLIFGFGWIVFRYGITFVQDFGDDLMETIPFTNNWYYPAMPVSGFLIMVFAFKLIVDEIVRPEAAAITGTSVD